MNRTMDDLAMLQALPLDVKIEKTKRRIKEWYDYWDGKVYIAFSGGKDSTVLLDLVRNICGYTDVPAVFIDTGLEYPEIREFVKNTANVEWLRPKKNFKEVIDENGYPFISKEVSNTVEGAKKYLKILTDRQIGVIPGTFHIPTTTDELKHWASILSKDVGKVQGSPCRLAKLLGLNRKDKMITVPESSCDRSSFVQTKWSFLLEAPFEVSAKCCDVMKKAPSHNYERLTGRKAITGQMASESRLRTSTWLKNGCNAYEGTRAKSNPMSFWTEQDVLLYIKLHNLPICSVYGDIVEDIEGTDEVEGQMTFSDLEGFENMELFDAKRPKLKTTACSRTGCMFCGYGCHLEKGEGRFEMMKRTHPKQYDYIMRPTEEGGLNYKEIIDWLNDNGNLNIRY